jgi:hypothetical protein
VQAEAARKVTKVTASNDRPTRLGAVPIPAPYLTV